MKYTLIRAHKRSLSLQVNSKGELIARAPYLMPKFMIDMFVAQKSSWIEKRKKAVSMPTIEPHIFFTQDQLKQFIHKELTKYSILMGLKYTGLKFTNVHSYWGTCAPSHVLSFNLALCYAPSDAVTYVVVHELSHIRWRGHGSRFWALVEKYYPDYKNARKILRTLSQNYRSG